MTERVLFVTGKLAEPRLKAILASLELPFPYDVWNAGVKVAALITESILLRRLPRTLQGVRVILPGRCRADLEALSMVFGGRFERGPDELADLPSYLGKQGRPADLTRHDLRLFAEIIDASSLTIDALRDRAASLKAAGADVIDLGCLPDTPFPRLEEAIRALHSDGHKVSVDSADTRELKRASEAGADYLLSLNEFTLDLAGASQPILIPASHGDLESLVRAYQIAKAKGISPILDPILDPIHYGFSDSLARYRELRDRLPEAEMMMGTGNLTELTEADSAGLTALLVGICSELRIANALTVHVSPHTRRTLQEHDAARRMMFAARETQSLPKGFGARLLQIHDKSPFTNEASEIVKAAKTVKDRNYRIEVVEDGIHLFNRDGHWVKTKAFDFYNLLDLGGDAAHAFYLGAELQKAEIAFRLGKRYVQDESLNWGIAADPEPDDRTQLKKAGDTLRNKQLCR